MGRLPSWSLCWAGAIAVQGPGQLVGELDPDEEISDGLAMAYDLNRLAVSMLGVLKLVR